MAIYQITPRFYRNYQLTLYIYTYLLVYPPKDLGTATSLAIDIVLCSKSTPSITGLHLAASIGLAKTVELLLKREGVDADSKDEYGRTPLWWAAKNGHEAVVKLLLEHKGVGVNSKAKGSRTPLWWATANGHEAVVKLLLEYKDIDANTKDTDSWTPLF
jgi:ankyrin repeat protein